MPDDDPWDSAEDPQLEIWGVDNPQSIRVVKGYFPGIYGRREAALDALLARVAVLTEELRAMTEQRNLLRDNALWRAERAERAEAEAERLKAAVQPLLAAAEAEVGPKTFGSEEKDADYWAALGTDQQVPGVYRRILLARAVLVARAALAGGDGT